MQLTTEQLFSRNLFLVMKEALHNVVKHARARNVHITFEWKGEGDHGTIGVTVADDGVGNANGEALAGNGMRNMRQRTSALGGTFAISSGNGTSVRYTVPLAPTNKGSIANSVEQPHLRTHDSRGNLDASVWSRMRPPSAMPSPGFSPPSRVSNSFGPIATP